MALRGRLFSASERLPSCFINAHLPGKTSRKGAERREAPAATDVLERLPQPGTLCASPALSGPSLFTVSEVRSLINSPRPAPSVCRSNEFIKAEHSKLLQQRII